MSDDERLERLTEMARRVWPQHASLRIELEPDWGQVRVLDGHPEDSSTGVLWCVEDVPMSGALDALEAALLVLLYPKQAAWALEPDPLAWVKALAMEWEARAARMLVEGGAEEAASEALRCAAALRERAQGGEP
jgi:hypothetical protein